MPLLAGDKLGPYEILAPIGEGGMGQVYKARDIRLDRIVAIKVSKTEFSERFEREAQAISALNHPHICQLYDVGPNYLVMEYVDGTPAKGPLGLEKTMEYARQITSALDAAHSKKITHRDLKPANTEFSESNPQFSPDGKWIAYSSDESGRSEIYVTAFPAGRGKRRVSVDGGTLPRWRRDAKHLFYTTLDHQLMAAWMEAKSGALEVGKIDALFGGLVDYDV